MLNQIIRVTPLANHRLEIEFQDGVYGTIDLSDRLFGEMFGPLRDETVFRKVSIDDFGAICWPNGADLAPDAIQKAAERFARVREWIAHETEKIAGEPGPQSLQHVSN